MTDQASLPPPDLSSEAARLFTVRAARAAQAVREGRQSKDQADTALRPWLALACMAGADLPHFAEMLAQRREVDLQRGELRIGEAALRALVAMDICPRPAVIATLEKARNAALDALPQQCALDDPKFQQASALNRLANHFACKPHLPGCTESQRRAA